MKNPFCILPLLWRSSRPSHTFDLPAVAVPFWIRKGYDGLTFFGHIITHTREDANTFNQHWDNMKNHEMIHLYQARATHDSWFCFYWQYMLFWLKARGYRRHLKNAGYKLNPFEMEAYANMDNLDYLKPGGKAEGWKRYAAMTLEERLKAYQKEILKR
jgi:hypothetical protein